MSHITIPRWVPKSLSATLLLTVGACGAAAPDDPQPLQAAQLASALGNTTSTSCDAASAGSGWVNTFIPQSTGSFSVELNNFVSAPGMPPNLDAVIGLSNGPADAFTDLGPIVRFNPTGSIDARNGNQYAGSFPYTTGVGPFAVRMDVNLSTRHYDVWVKHNDAIGKTFELLGSNFAFRTEQSQLTRIDNIARFVDGNQGQVESCAFKDTSPTACTSSGVGAWASQAFLVQTGVLRLDFDATPSAAAIDAVIGASQGAPTAFTSLAATVRFNPNGTLDARKGGAFAADASVPYSAGTSYHFTVDIDRAAHSYSVSVNAPGQSPIALASNYPFRSEQAQITSLDHLGQFVDGTPGSVAVCALTVAY